MARNDTDDDKNNPEIYDISNKLYKKEPVVEVKKEVKIEKKEKSLFDEIFTNMNILISIGILLSLVIILLIYFLTKKSKNFLKIIKTYG